MSQLTTDDISRALLYPIMSDPLISRRVSR